jgi:hypothetical protein
MSMDRITAAARRYQAIVTDKLVAMDPAERYSALPVAKIRAWIAEYVLPAIEDLYGRPVFRDHATRPQRTLAAGTQSPERVAIEQTSRALASSAAALGKLTKNRRIASKLRELAPTRAEFQAAQTVSVTENATIWVKGIPRKQELVPYYLNQLERIASRPWSDLVCVDDYFCPVGGMMLRSPLPTGVTEGAFVASLSAHLFFVGDSITRCMLQRVRSWTSVLNEARQVCYQVVGGTGRRYQKQLRAEQETWEQLREARRRLENLCLTGLDAQMRDSCIAMVQLYAEYHPSPDLSWLGVSDVAFAHFQGRLRQNIESARDLETIERIAAALASLRLLYRDLPPTISAIDEAVAGGGLVLIGQTREVFWERQPISKEWNRYSKPWELLWQLAAKARAGSAVGNFDLYRDGVSDSTIANRWLRLKAMLPGTLWKCVKPGWEKATYRLDLPINQVFLFQSRGEGGR